MPRFQLVFRTADGDRTELWHSSEEEPCIGETPIVDGGTYLIRGAEWVLRQDDDEGMTRYRCTPADDPTSR